MISSRWENIQVLITAKWQEVAVNVVTVRCG